MKVLRGIHGASRWLSTSVRPDLAAAISMSAGTAGSATTSDPQKASAIVEVAKAEADLPLTTQLIPFDSIRFVSFSESAWG